MCVCQSLHFNCSLLVRNLHLFIGLIDPAIPFPFARLEFLMSFLSLGFRLFVCVFVSLLVRLFLLILLL